MFRHDLEETISLASGNDCTLLRIRNDFIPDYYLLTFPKSAGEPLGLRKDAAPRMLR